jgi:dGTPase
VLVANFARNDPYSGTAEQRAALRVFSGNLIGRYINAASMANENGTWRVTIDPELHLEVTILKELVWTYVIEAPALASQQYGQRKIIRDLFGIYSEAAQTKSEHKMFPPYYRERLAQAERGRANSQRICVDLLAGMTERQALALYLRLTGASPGSGLEDLLM